MTERRVFSVDFIKSDLRRNVFIEQCPELVIVDEAHTCARPTGASTSQQQRYHLISRIAAKPNQQLVLLTATPHSGKPEEFHSLLGLLDPAFETLDLPNATQAERRSLARSFVQRKRADVEKWLDEETPFPMREAFEWPYELSPAYADCFERLLDFARKLVAPDTARSSVQKVHYWTALALLRGVMSSPEAGIEMLNSRLERLASGTDEPGALPGDLAEELAEALASDENPVGDTEFGFEGDNTPTQVVQRHAWSGYQRQQLRGFADQLAALANLAADLKLAATALIIEEWLDQGINPVIFCRYIATATYVGAQLAPALQRRFRQLDVQVITSESPDDLRKQRIEAMGKAKQRVLIATDCLSEGINLQDHFTGVLHYDLPWNPNRLEQREGRVDRFGQTAPTVKACLLYGADNPIDGIVLDVLLRKVREIKRATGINVPFPEDSQSIIDTIIQALLLNPERKVTKRKTANKLQLTFDFGDFDEAAQAKANITRKVDEAAEREKISRSIFAQNAIKAQEIEADLHVVDEAIGDPKAVEAFVVNALTHLLGVQVTPVTLPPSRPSPGAAVAKQAYRIVTGNLPEQLRALLPPGEPVLVSFASPTPPGYHYLGRNHRFVEQLCQLIMANTLAQVDHRAARAAVIRTNQVALKTILLLFRCRNVIEDRRGQHQIVAEEMILGGWQGTPQQRIFLDHAQAKTLLTVARATTELSPQARASFLANEAKLLAALQPEFDTVAEAQAKQLVEAHERFTALMGGQRYQVVYPVLPMDLMGIYILLPS